MQLVLTETLDRWIEDQVRGGEFEDANAVVRDALYKQVAATAPAESAAAIEALRALIRPALEQMDRGEFADFDPDRINRELDTEMDG